MNLDAFDWAILIIGAVLIAGEHATIRYAPNLVRYGAGTAVILGLIIGLLWHHGQGTWIWVPVLAAMVTGTVTAFCFVVDGVWDVWRLWKSEGPMPLRAFWARLRVLYRRTHGEG